MAECGRKATAGDHSDLWANFAIARENGSAFARGQPPLQREADPFARRAIHDFTVDPLGPRETAFHAAALVDAEQQPGLGRAGLGRIGSASCRARACQYV